MFENALRQLLSDFCVDVVREGGLVRTLADAGRVGFIVSVVELLINKAGGESSQFRMFKKA